MKTSKIINMIGAVLVITFFILRSFFPDINTGFLSIGIAIVLCIMMLYKTGNARPINILGLVFVLILSVLHLIVGDKLNFLLSGLPGLISVVLLSTLIFYSHKKSE